MTIYYDSRTGNVERFARKVSSLTGWQCLKISDEIVALHPGHLITYTTRVGCVPPSTERFMEKYHPLIRSVSSSGNMNWGSHFAEAADKLSSRYGIPVLSKFELSGLRQDVDCFVKRVSDFGREAVADDPSLSLCRMHTTRLT